MEGRICQTATSRIYEWLQIGSKKFRAGKLPDVAGMAEKTVPHFRAYTFILWGTSAVSSVCFLFSAWNSVRDEELVFLKYDFADVDHIHGCCR